MVSATTRLNPLSRDQRRGCGALLGSFAMSESDQRPEVEAAEELLAEMPLPSDAKTFFLGGIFVLSTLMAG